LIKHDLEIEEMCCENVRAGPLEAYNWEANGSKDIFKGLINVFIQWFTIPLN